MDTYIVRIYRQPKGSSRLVLGVVERVGRSGVTRFSTFDELRGILCGGRERRRSAGIEQATPAVGAREGDGMDDADTFVTARGNREKPSDLAPQRPEKEEREAT